MAERLAAKLDYSCLSREELIEAATREGIQVGKLEMAMIKPSIFSERLAVEREHYLAFTTAFLCDRAMEGRLVYHGRTGHLLLPGVDHVLRIRVVTDQERRIARAMSQLGVGRDKAIKYLDEVDEDWRRWVHSMYQTSWEDAAHYDLTMNLEQMSLENAASALVGLAQLPDFQMTPASKNEMLDLQLAAKVRLALARDERTAKAGFKVRADGGVVTLTYLPKDSACAEHIQEVAAGIPGIKEFRATMASTNILWVQETFRPDSDTYREVVEIANKWNAAVELARLYPPDENGDAEAGAAEAVKAETNAEGTAEGASADNGGIEEDEEEAACDDGGMTETLEELAREGRSGGGHIVCGGGESLLGTLSKTNPYTLVVIGDIFENKGHETRMRETRNLQSYLSDRIKAPVVTADELKTQYLFGKRDVAKLAGYLIIVAVIYGLVFMNQEPVIKFISGEWWDGAMAAKAIVAAAVAVFVPIVAYTYGNVSKSLMKLLKME